MAETESSSETERAPLITGKERHRRKSPAINTYLEEEQAIDKAESHHIPVSDSFDQLDQLV